MTWHANRRRLLCSSLARRRPVGEKWRGRANDTEANMARVTGEAVKLLAHQLYDYNVSDDVAEAVAHMVGATASYARRLESLNITGLQPPFGYPALIAQAERSRRNSK